MEDYYSGSSPAYIRLYGDRLAMHSQPDAVPILGSRRYSTMLQEASRLPRPGRAARTKGRRGQESNLLWTCGRARHYPRRSRTPASRSSMAAVQYTWPPYPVPLLLAVEHPRHGTNLTQIVKGRGEPAEVHPTSIFVPFHGPSATWVCRVSLSAAGRACLRSRLTQCSLLFARVLQALER